MNQDQLTLLEEHSALLYSVYREAVGGTAFNGEPLPYWEDFAADPNKELQANAWRSVAKQSLELDAECGRLHALWHAAEEKLNALKP
jgi:hypothetical protein